MNLYCNFARENWTQAGENPPVGLILCTDKDDALAHCAMEGLHNKMLVREYLTALAKESALAAEIARTREFGTPSGVASVIAPVAAMRTGFGLRAAAGKVERRAQMSA